MYDCMYKMFCANVYKCPWIVFVKKSLDELGLSYIFDCQGNCINHTWFQNTIKLRLQDAYKQEWNSQVYLRDSCNNYMIYKSDFVFEKYLVDLPWSLASSKLKFRTRNSPPPITKHYLKKNDANNILIDKQCPLCDDTCNNVDEFHYIMKCKYLVSERNKLISKQISPINVNNFNAIMNGFNKNNLKVRNLARFMRIIIDALNSLNKR